MTERWVRKRKREDAEKLLALNEELVRYVDSLGLSPEDCELLLDDIREDTKWSCSYYGTVALTMDLDGKLKNSYKLVREINKRFAEPMHFLKAENYDRYLDRTKHFDGDILITDPCYVARDNDWTGFYDHPDFLSNHGFTTFMHRDTMYGDWGCTVFDAARKPIGRFCADAGLVGVYYVDEVLRYNPDFQEYISNRPWCVAVIKNFSGTVTFNVRKTRYKYDGQWHAYYSLVVIGNGLNKETGQDMSFLARQTSL